MEVTALRGCGDIGAIEREDTVEDVAGVGHVVGVGHDNELVRFTATRRTDVEPTARGGAGDEVVADVNGDALVAVLGRRVPEPGMVTDVVDR